MVRLPRPRKPFASSVHTGQFESDGYLARRLKNSAWAARKPSTDYVPDRGVCLHAVESSQLSVVGFCNSCQQFFFRLQKKFGKADAVLKKEKASAGRLATDGSCLDGHERRARGGCRWYEEVNLTPCLHPML